MMNTVDAINTERQAEGRRFIEALLASHKKIANNTYNINRYELMLKDPKADLYNEMSMVRALYGAKS